jgi:hypothetical protein
MDVGARPSEHIIAVAQARAFLAKMGTVHQAAATRHKMPVDREAEPKLPLPLGEEGTGRRNGKRCATAS